MAVAVSAAAHAVFGEGDAGVRVTADIGGEEGNRITVALVDPQANSSALSINVVGQAITVSLATDAAGALTTTATQLVAALNAHADASALVTAAATGGGTGVVAAAPATGLTTPSSDAHAFSCQPLEFLHLKHGTGESIWAWRPAGIERAVVVYGEAP